MDTVYYTLHTGEASVTARAAKASGSDGPQTDFPPQPVPQKLPHRENNVISLEEYRARLTAQEIWAENREEPEERPALRPRTDHSREPFPLLEAAASAALIAVSLAACAAFLL